MIFYKKKKTCPVLCRKFISPEVWLRNSHILNLKEMEEETTKTTMKSCFLISLCFTVFHVFISRTTRAPCMNSGHAWSFGLCLSLFYLSSLLFVLLYYWSQVTRPSTASKYLFSSIWVKSLSGFHTIMCSWIRLEQHGCSYLSWLPFLLFKRWYIFQKSRCLCWIHQNWFGPLFLFTFLPAEN